METKDYSEQLKKSIEWAKQTRWCSVQQTMTPHKVFFANKETDNKSGREVYVCGWCGNTTEETK